MFSDFGYHLPVGLLPAPEHEQVIGVINEIFVANIAVIAVADEQVFPSVVIKIGEERSPAPVGSCDAGHLSDFAEGGFARVSSVGSQLKGIAHVLWSVTRLLNQFCFAPGEVADHLFSTLGGFRKHIHHNQIQTGVVIDIREVAAHAVVRLVIHERINQIDKSLSMVVYPQ